MDGAVQRPAADATAFPWRNHDYMLTVEANWEGTDSEAHVEWARETDAAFRDLGAEGAYAGFPGLDETDDDECAILLLNFRSEQRTKGVRDFYHIWV